MPRRLFPHLSVFIDQPISHARGANEQTRRIGHCKKTRLPVTHIFLKQADPGGRTRQLFSFRP